MRTALFAEKRKISTGTDADWLNELPKIVFSRTLEKVEWRNSRLVIENVAEEVARLKQQSGNDIALFGSAELASTFMRLGLIDEYRIFVTPLILGRGTPMFRDIKDRIALNLSKATTWSSGVAALYYQPTEGKDRSVI